MKRAGLLVMLVALVTSAWFFWTRRRGPRAAPSLASSPRVVPTTSVEALAEHPDQFKGFVRVHGVVGRVAAERQMFSLADLSDKAELQRTGGTQCLVLPVKWAGPMPTALQDFSVEGSVQQAGGKLLLVATAVEPPRCTESEVMTARKIRRGVLPVLTLLAVLGTHFAWTSYFSASDRWATLDDQQDPSCFLGFPE